MNIKLEATISTSLWFSSYEMKIIHKIIKGLLILFKRIRELNINGTNFALTLMIRFKKLCYAAVEPFISCALAYSARQR